MLGLNELCIQDSSYETNPVRDSETEFSAATARGKDPFCNNYARRVRSALLT
jgi:hypothetical protein